MSNDELISQEMVDAHNRGLAAEPRSEIAVLISEAIAANLDIEKLTKLLELKRQEEEIDRLQRAQEAYLKAKSKFLGSCRVINADKRADKFNYPSYGKILETALPLMAKVGLSHTTTPDFEKEIVTCVMKHTLGHEESATFPMTIEGQPSTGRFQLSLQQKWAHALTYAERQSFKAVSGVPTSDSDIDMLPQAELKGGADDQDPLLRIATEAEYKALKSGWWKFAQPAVGTPERADFDSLDPAELGDLFMGWVGRSITRVTLGFIKFEKPHECFTARQIVDLWAIINQDKEDKDDVGFITKEG